MILKRQKTYSFLGNIIDAVRSSNIDFQQETKDFEKIRKLHPYTPEIGKELDKYLPKEYKKLETFFKTIDKMFSGLSFNEFGLEFNYKTCIWDNILLRKIYSLGEFISSKDRFRIIDRYGYVGDIYWNFKRRRWENHYNKEMSWQDVKSWIIKNYEYDMKYLGEKDLEDGEDMRKEINFCKEAIKKAKTLL